MPAWECWVSCTSSCPFASPPVSRSYFMEGSWQPIICSIGRIGPLKPSCGTWAGNEPDTTIAKQGRALRKWPEKSEQVRLRLSHFTCHWWTLPDRNSCFFPTFLLKNDGRQVQVAQLSTAWGIKINLQEEINSYFHSLDFVKWCIISRGALYKKKTHLVLGVTMESSLKCQWMRIETE